MIDFKTGNILASNAEALVNTVNCVGIMGRGIALQFKTKFPANFKAYAAACESGDVQPGRMFVFSTGWLTGPKYIINFPTKRHWRGDSRLEDIDSGLAALRNVILERGIQSIAVPPLGSGLGGLDWTHVRSRIERTLGTLDGVRIEVFEPNPESTRQSKPSGSKAPNMTPSRAALVELVRNYLAGLLDPSVTLLEVHKLMYFMQLAGEPLNLKFTQAPYGPFAENLRYLLMKIEGYFLSGYADGGDSPTKQLQLVPGAVDDAQRIIASHPDTRNRMQRVTDLVDGFETPFGLELLSTVHWVASRCESCTDAAIIQGTYAWSERKRQFTERQIRIALKVLTEKDWLPPFRVDAAESNALASS
ncbi:MAG TPA: macro domain-containing protein [Terracidiphilus sp.]